MLVVVSEVRLWSRVGLQRHSGHGSAALSLLVAEFFVAQVRYGRVPRLLWCVTGKSRLGFRVGG